MFGKDNDEHDEDRDKDEAGANRDEEDEKKGDDQEEDKSGEGDEDEDSNDDEDSDDEDSDEDDDKPVSRKELREALARNGNDRNANRRIHSKDRNDQSGRDRDNRHNSQQSSKTEERLKSIEISQRKSALIEAKRNFGYDNSLSPAQVDVVFKMTKRPTKKFLDTPYVKAALNEIAREANVRDNTPSSGGRGSFKSNSGKSWEKMSEQERQDNFADRRRGILANKRG